MKNDIKYFWSRESKNETLAKEFCKYQPPCCSVFIY